MSDSPPMVIDHPKVVLGPQPGHQIRYTCAEGLRPRTGSSFELHVMPDPGRRAVKAKDDFWLQLAIARYNGLRIDEMPLKIKGLTPATLCAPYLFDGELIGLAAWSEELYVPLLSRALVAGLSAHFAAGRDGKEISVATGIADGDARPDELLLTLTFEPTGATTQLRWLDTEAAGRRLSRYFTYANDGVTL